MQLLWPLFSLKPQKIKMTHTEKISYIFPKKFFPKFWDDCWNCLGQLSAPRSIIKKTHPEKISCFTKKNKFFVHLGRAVDKAVRINLYPQASNTKITHSEEKFIIFFQLQTNETNKQIKKTCLEKFLLFSRKKH